ncbi:MAG: PorT family protein [Sphingobacteriales bacterium]|nr:MAG: PorT family protein [Sphingobacteriales bacterium]
MKKFFLLSMLLILSSINIFAQFNLGIKTGINYAMISTREGQFDYKGALGYQAGVWGRVGKSIYFQPEVYASTKNTDITFKQTGTNISPQGKLNFTTIDLPLLIGKQIGIHKLNFHFVIGPSIQFILNEDKTITTQVSDLTFYNYKPIIANLQAGGGVDFGNLSIDLRYETGVKDMNTKKGQHNNLIHFSVGYKLF